MKRVSIFSVVIVILVPLVQGCMGNKNDQILSHLDEAKYKKAIREADKALEGEPEDKKLIVYNRGRAKMHLERYDEAIDDFQESLKMNSDNEWAKWPTYRIGQVNMKRGNYEEAVNKFTSALNFDHDWTKAMEARAEAKSQMGDEVEAEEDRQLVREIEERRARKRRQRKVKQERKELKEEWNNETGEAPIRNYSLPVRVEGRDRQYDIWDRSNVMFSDYDCEYDKADTFEEVDQKMSELGGRLVKKEREGGSDDPKIDATWEFTWWYDSHPNIKFNWHRRYIFDICEEQDKVQVYEGLSPWGHEPQDYYYHIDYEENEEYFPVHPDGSMPVCISCE